MKRTVKRMVRRLLHGKASVPQVAGPVPARAAPPEDSSRSWSTSSLDLKHGADIVEFSQDTMPSAFYDEGFEPHAPRPPRKK